MSDFDMAYILATSPFGDQLWFAGLQKSFEPIMLTQWWGNLFPTETSAHRWYDDIEIQCELPLFLAKHEVLFIGRNPCIAWVHRHHQVASDSIDQKDAPDIDFRSTGKAMGTIPARMVVHKIKFGNDASGKDSLLRAVHVLGRYNKVMQTDILSVDPIDATTRLTTSETGSTVADDPGYFYTSDRFLGFESGEMWVTPCSSFAIVASWLNADFRLFTLLVLRHWLANAMTNRPWRKCMEG